jgi:DNA-binding transcriptional regulator YbjK
MGNESAHGGVVLDELAGIAMESLGVKQLQKLADQLDAKTCRETAATLETLDSQRQTWDEVMQQERDWSRRAFPGIRYELVRLVERNSMQKIDQLAEQKFENQQTKTRQLIINLAARGYDLDKGHRPASVANLVPDYLKAIPQDPITGTNMVYSP